MDDIKTYKNEEIQDNPFPQGQVAVPGGSDGTGKTYSNQTIPDQPVPKRVVASELISSILNTQSKKILGEVQFTEQGAIQIGKYDPGVSGDVRISPSGIVARNKDGANTVTIDGDTGDATFKGNLLAGTIITGRVEIGSGLIVLDGASGNIMISDGVNDRILIGYQQGGF